MAEGPARVGWRVVRGVWGGGRALKPAIQGRWGVKLSISLLILVRAMLLRASQGSYSLQRRGVGPKCNLHACMSDVSAKLLYTVTVSTSSIVYIKSDFRKPSSLYSLHIKHSHTHTHTHTLNTIPQHINHSQASGLLLQPLPPPVLQISATRY